MTVEKAIILANGLVLVAIVVCLVLWPVGYSTTIIRSGALSDGEIPDFAYDWHASLSKKLEPWASQRVASGRATEVSTYDVAGTEWPIFSAVFYLWATEALQDSATEDGYPENSQPAIYAADAIRAAADLVADPGHAFWVIDHWGDTYLEKENLFYRMLLISGLTSYKKLSGDASYDALLRDQVTSLAAELDASPFGLLDDYPGQCYPIDIVPAIAAIKRADGILETDHSEMVARAIRGFQGTSLDPSTGLPAYIADSRTGEGRGHARGVGVSFMTIWAAETWPDIAQDWYEKFDRHFWHQGRWISGFREYPSSVEHADLIFDVDAGPVVYGIGATASAFGIGTARTMGRFDHAYALSAQAFATMLPMIDGSLLVPRTLSNLTDAPFTGEAIILFNFTRRPKPGVQIITKNGQTPGTVYVIFATLGLTAALLFALITRRVRMRLRRRYSPIRFPTAQLVLWLVIVLIGLILLYSSQIFAFALVVILTQFLPIYWRPETSSETGDRTSSERRD